MKRLLSIVIVLLLSSSIAPAQDFCKGDFAFDGDVDADDVEEFLNHFGRFEFNNPCPPDGPAPVAKTGRTVSHIPGDDGDLERGVPWPNPRFTNNGDGTVTDNLTGLIWLRDANCSLFDAPRTWDYTFNVIIPQLEDGYCGLTDGSSPGDWRIPNRFELESLLYLGCLPPAIPNTVGNACWSENDSFNNVMYENYWTSTHYGAVTDNRAWGVYIVNGAVNYYFHSSELYIWPVRGGH